MQVTDARRYLLVLWLGIMAIQVANQVTWAWQQGTGKAPQQQCTTDYMVPPHKLLGAAVVFTLLFGLAEWTPELAVVFGAGLDLAALLGPLVAGQPGQSGNTLFDRLAQFVQASA